MTEVDHGFDIGEYHFILFVGDELVIDQWFLYFILDDFQIFDIGVFGMDPLLENIDSLFGIFGLFEPLLDGCCQNQLVFDLENSFL